MLRIVEYYFLYSSNLKCFSGEKKKQKQKTEQKQKQNKKTQKPPLLLRS